jgi:hypothetical protein
MNKKEAQNKLSPGDFKLWKKNQKSKSKKFINFNEEE